MGRGGVGYFSQGVLLSRPENWTMPLGEPRELIVHLNDHETGIVMAVSLRHVEGARLGFKCEYIDLESASHLKRLVELNLVTRRCLIVSLRTRLVSSSGLVNSVEFRQVVVDGSPKYFRSILK